MSDRLESVLLVEASEDLPQARMPDSFKRLFEVYEVVEQIALMLLCFSMMIIENLIYSHLL